MKQDHRSGSRQREQADLLEEALRHPGVAEAAKIQEQLDAISQRYQSSKPAIEQFATGGNP